MGTVKYSGPVASFHCPTEAEIRSLKVHFSPKQEGSGDPSPENIREIVGWNGVEVKRSGRNLFDTGNAVLISSDAWCNSTTHKITSSNGDKTLYIPCLANSVYTVSKSIGDVLAGGYTTDVPTTGVDLYSYYRDNSARTITITTGDNAKYIAIWYYDKSKTHDKTMTPEDIRNTLQIEYGVTKNSYEPYRGETTNYEFGVLGKNKLDKNSYKYLNSSIICFGGTTSSEPDGSLFLKAGTYTFSVNTTAGTIFATDANKMNIVLASNTNSATFTLSESLAVRIGCAIQGATDEEMLAYNYQLELGSTATTYEPYNPNHTVYGGWVDLISGEVCATYDCITVDDTCSIDAPNLNGNEPWKHRWSIRKWDYNTSKWFFKNNTNILYCDRLNKVSSATKNGEIYGVTVETRVYLYDDEITTTEEFHAKYDGMELCAPVTEPYNTYQIAPTFLQTFLGQNNVWSNADYVEVEYDLHETQTILEQKQFIVANQPHVESASGAIASFETDMAAPLKGCTVEFKPVQDLNGYSKPWPAGGGKNLFDASQIGTSTSAAFITLQLVADTTYTFSSNKPSGAGGFSIQTTNTDLETAGAVYDNHPIIFTALNDASISIRYYNGSDTSLQDYWYQLEKGSAATSYAPYENVCPISGWTGVEVNKCRTNLIDPTKKTVSATVARWYYADGYLLVAGKTYTLTADKNGTVYIINKTTGTVLSQGNNKRSYTPIVDTLVYFQWYATSGAQTVNAMLAINNEDTVYEPYNGTIIPITFPSVINVLSSTTITANKTLSAAGEEISESGMSLTNYIKVNEGDTYTLTFVSKEGARTRRIYGYNVNKEPVESLAAASWVTVDTTYSLQATIPAGIEYIRVCYKTADENIFLEGPESSIFYGGYVDLVKGELIQICYNMIVNENTAIHTFDNKHGVYRIVYTLPYLGANKNALMCNKFGLRDRNSAMYNYPTKGLIALGDHNTNTTSLQIGAPGEITTQEQWLNWLVENGPIQVIYELAEPVYYSLTPQTLKTLRGTNNIWSSANGNIELQYWKH